jgi:hypothetical protein
MIVSQTYFIHTVLAGTVAGNIQIGIGLSFVLASVGILFRGEILTDQPPTNTSCQY